LEFRGYDLSFFIKKKKKFFCFKKRIDDISSNTNQIGFEGSDEEIRLKFESYLSSLLFTVKQSCIATESPTADGKRFGEYISDYGSHFIKAWQQTLNYKLWEEQMKELEFPEQVK
jgi:hypothetical protein